MADTELSEGQTPEASSDFEPWTPQVAEEDTAKKQAEQAKLSSSVGILQDFFSDLDADIEAHRGIELINGLNVSTNAEEFKLAGLLNNEIRTELEKLRDKYRVRYSQYVQEDGK